jgi:hypothetical protein
MDTGKTWSRFVRAIALLVAFLVGSCLPAAAGDEIAAGQSVIQSQEEAFGRDDAAAAYTFAAPGIQKLFPSPEIFMSMVRKGYAPVYRHQSFEFGEGVVLDGHVVQEVHIVDAQGAAWDALYTLEPQPDGSLKISACVLKKAVIS